MPGQIVNKAKDILNKVEELRVLESKLDSFAKNKRPNLADKKLISDLVRKKSLILSSIDINLSDIYKLVGMTQKDIINVLPKPQLVLPKPKDTIKIAFEPVNLVPEFTSSKFRNLTKEEKKKYIKELDINYEYLEKFVKLQKNREKIRPSISKEPYSIYKPSKVGQIANRFMKSSADNLVTKYPKFFEPMFGHFKMVEMELLSRSYVSMMLFFSLLSLPAIFLFLLVLNFAFNLSILTIILLAILGMIVTFLVFYFYPASLIGGKTQKIKLELPFALVHMSAVAGSGAQPISIFQLIADSEDYPELRKEIKKVLNYVNLFGYNLTTALKNVALTTPSPEFKELLNGMVSTIETGGDLKEYLKDKAEEALNTYKLDRKKQIEALATYSEIYTAILIAAPLLLLVTLAIMNSIGGSFGGLSATTIGWISIVGALPLLNVGFMIFISTSQKGL